MMRADQVTDDVMDTIASILQTCAAFDQRTVGVADVVAWSMAVGDLPEQDVVEAVVHFYVETPTDAQGNRPWVTPGDVIKRVRAVRRDRLEHTPVPAPDTGDPAAYIAANRRAMRQIADGTGINPRTILRAVPSPEAPRVGAGDRKALTGPETTADEPLAGAPAAPEYDEAAYEGAYATLLDLDDKGDAVMAQARAEKGPDAPVVAVVMRAAELATQAAS